MGIMDGEWDLAGFMIAFWILVLLGVIYRIKMLTGTSMRIGRSTLHPWFSLSLVTFLLTYIFHSVECN